MQKFNENHTQDSAERIEVIASREHMIRWLDGAWILKKDFSRAVICA